MQPREVGAFGDIARAIGLESKLAVDFNKGCVAASVSSRLPSYSLLSLMHIRVPHMRLGLGTQARNIGKGERWAG